MAKSYKYQDILEIDNVKLTKSYIESLSKQQRLDLIQPIFDLLREIGMLYPDDENKIHSEYKRLIEYKPDISTLEVFNNSSLATNLSTYFCKDFFKTIDKNNKTMFDNFYDDLTLKKIIHNRLGLDWLDDDGKGKGVNEAFNLSFKMIFYQAQRSMRLVATTSIFKPAVAKYMYERYSNENDTIYDYSVGWGARMIGATSCNRKYIGTDPLTIKDVSNMKNTLSLKNVTLLDSGSEFVMLEPNSIDFCFSSPPYYDQEIYSKEISQAYNQGEDYFYNTYWKNTLKSIKIGLKPNKYFGLNITNKYSKMIEMAKDEFGECVEQVQLKTTRSHLNKTAGVIKFEPIFMFKNAK